GGRRLTDRSSALIRSATIVEVVTPHATSAVGTVGDDRCRSRNRGRECCCLRYTPERRSVGRGAQCDTRLPLSSRTYAWHRRCSASGPMVQELTSKICSVVFVALVATGCGGSSNAPSPAARGATDPGVEDPAAAPAAPPATGGNGATAPDTGSTTTTTTTTTTSTPTQPAAKTHHRCAWPN